MNMSNDATVADVQASLDTSPFIKAFEMKAERWDYEAQELEMTMPFSDLGERLAGSGQFHGGPIAALIDTVGCFALGFVLGHGVPTINFRTDYLRPGMAPGLRAIAKVRRAGRSVGVVDVDVFSHDGEKLVAVGRATYSSNPG